MATSATSSRGQERQDQHNTRWRSSELFEDAVHAKIQEVNWRDTPLREGLKRLGASQRIAIWLDRRVDPLQRVTADARDMTFIDSLRRLVSSLELDVCVVEPIVYVGPRETAKVLATLAEIKRVEALGMTGEARAALLRVDPWSWEMLAEPNVLLRQCVEETGLTWMSPSVVPHDLWPAEDYPPTSLSNRLVLLLSGFRSTYQWDAQRRRLTVVDLPLEASLRAAYRLPGNKARGVATLRREIADSELRVQGDQLWVDGRWEDHQVVKRWLGKSLDRAATKTTRTTPKGPPEQRYSLRAVNPAGSLIQEIGRRLNFAVEFDPTCGERLQVRIELDTQEVTREELIKSILEPAGLTHQWRQQTLLVSPRQ